MVSIAQTGGKVQPAGSGKVSSVKEKGDVVAGSERTINVSCARREINQMKENSLEVEAGTAHEGGSNMSTSTKNLKTHSNVLTWSNPQK